MHSPLTIGDMRPQMHTFTFRGAHYPLSGVASSEIEWHVEDMDKHTETVCSGTWEMSDAQGGKAMFTPSKEELSWGVWSHEGTYKAYPVVAGKAMDAQALTFKKGG